MVNQSNMLSKALVIGTFILFIGMCVNPSTGNILEKKSTIPISNANILFVGGDGPGNYTRIQDAIDAASDGDTVFVYAYSSPYKEHIVVDKSVNLIGEDSDKTVFDGSYSSNVVNISADWVNISGFTIKYGYSYGIKINSSYNTINGNIISNNKVGIVLHRARNNTIMGNTISKNIKGIAMVSLNSGHTILKNNFFLNIKHVFFRCLRDTFTLQLPNKWSQNYWGRPRLLPKLLFGIIIIVGPGGDFPGFFIFPLPLFNIDWRPALKPYDLEGVI